VYFLHRVKKENVIEGWKEMKKLVEEGKVKHIGLSEANEEYIRKCHAIHPVASVQIEYSLGCREIEEDVMPVCKELGIGIMAYSPLARGIFTKPLP
jgi:aryl-alcohol dehydrogenase-like predicted oxidoreductase